jgi:hypothetical protein
MSSYNLLYKLITYVKDKGGNLSTLAQALISIVNYGPLQFFGSCFSHAFNKTCQYICNDTKVSIGFKEVSLKAAQSTL